MCLETHFLGFIHLAESQFLDRKENFWTKDMTNEKSEACGVKKEQTVFHNNNNNKNISKNCYYYYYYKRVENFEILSCR